MYGNCNYTTPGNQPRPMQVPHDDTSDVEILDSSPSQSRAPSRSCVQSLFPSAVVVDDSSVGSIDRSTFPTNVSCNIPVQGQTSETSSNTNVPVAPVGEHTKPVTGNPSQTLVVGEEDVPYGNRVLKIESTATVSPCIPAALPESPDSDPRSSDHLDIRREVQLREAVTQTFVSPSPGPTNAETSDKHTDLNAESSLFSDFPLPLGVKDSTLHPSVDMHSYCYCCYTLPERAYTPIPWPPRNDINMGRVVSFNTAFHTLMIKAASGTNSEFVSEQQVCKGTIPSRLGHGRCYCCYECAFLKMDPLPWPPRHKCVRAEDRLDQLDSDDEVTEDMNYEDGPSGFHSKPQEDSLTPSHSPTIQMTHRTEALTDSERFSDNILSRMFGSPESPAVVQPESPKSVTIFRSPVDNSLTQVRLRNSCATKHTLVRKDTPNVGHDCQMSLPQNTRQESNSKRKQQAARSSCKRKNVVDLDVSLHPHKPKRFALEKQNTEATTSEILPYKFPHRTSARKMGDVQRALPTNGTNESVVGNLDFYADGKIKTWLCDLCDHSFQNNSSFVRHFLRFHVTETNVGYVKFKVPSARASPFHCIMSNCDYTSKSKPDRKAYLIGAHECSYIVETATSAPSTEPAAQPTTEFRTGRSYRYQRK